MILRRGELSAGNGHMHEDSSVTDRVHVMVIVQADRQEGILAIWRVRLRQPCRRALTRFSSEWSADCSGNHLREPPCKLFQTPEGISRHYFRRSRA
jgi:hypothetical protein